jgi:hypothetical protein
LHIDIEYIQWYNFKRIVGGINIMEKYEVLEEAGVFKNDQERIEYIENELIFLEGFRHDAWNGMGYVNLLKAQLSVLQASRARRLSYATTYSEIAKISYEYDHEIRRKSSDIVYYEELYFGKIRYADSRMMFLEGIKSGIQDKLERDDIVLENI